LTWLEDAHLGYEEGNRTVFDKNIHVWVTIPTNIDFSDNSESNDSLAQCFLILSVSFGLVLTMSYL
jgi:hypothetical protein